MLENYSLTTECAVTLQAAVMDSMKEHLKCFLDCHKINSPLVEYYFDILVDLETLVFHFHNPLYLGHKYVSNQIGLRYQLFTISNEKEK